MTRSNTLASDIAFCAWLKGTMKADVFLLRTSNEFRNLTSNSSRYDDQLNATVDDAACSFGTQGDGTLDLRYGLGWSKDGKTLGFISAYTQNPLDTYISTIDLNRDGRLQPPTIWQDIDREVGQYYGLSWSPTTRTIATTARTQFNIADFARNLYVGDPLGKALIRLTALDTVLFGPDPVAPSPSWSPDGSSIAFNLGSNDLGHTVGAGIGIYGISDNTLTIVSEASNDQLAGRAEVGYAGIRPDPVWHTDNNHVVFVASSSHCNCPALYQVHRTGRDLRRLREHVVDAAISPDGSRLAVVVSTATAVTLQVLHPDGTLIRDIIRWPNRTAVGAPAIISEIEWAPSGSAIAFVSNIKGDLDIYSISPDGSNLVRLTDWAGDEASPKWRPETKQ